MGFRHRGATQRRCQQPCFADSRQRAERRPADRGRIGSDSGFAVGCAAGRSSRGLHWRRARCGPVVRFFPRAVLLEVGEDGADGGGFLDAGDDPHGATAVDAGGDVDGKDPLEGVVCGRGRNPTLRLWPTIFSGKIDVFPGDRRSRLISSMTSVAPA